ncbi:MAG: phenylalanine--tRNA ligase subunit beta [Alphaproteobacteria bacterium]|nr:phenylalanine--tRNA ligase subunit beta [Alphaproteobacteria bacterium]
MKLSLTWLKQYLDTNASVVEITDKLTSIGLEVEDIEDKATALQDFIIGEITAKEKHPNADKLNVLTVWTGSKNLQIVCGAPNCYVGMKSVLAKVGTMIPHYGEKLEKGVIRGIESFGMMCSERELGIGDDHTGIIDLKTDKPAGTPVSEVIKSEVMIDINVTPNRGDCFGIKGIARDLAATGIGTFIDTPTNPVKGTFESPVKVTIIDENCPHFVGRYIRGVKNIESPDWLKERLISVGLRPISALVDITNYLNIGECRPLHVFDADKIAGNLVVRSANDGETLKALDEKEYTLQSGMTVIADDNGAQSIAGIMGGEPTGCSEETVNVFLESAYFTPLCVAATGRLLNAESDSRTRFERGIDPSSAIQGNEIATRLILDICGGEVSELVIAGSEPDWTHTIEFDFGQVERLTGMAIAQDKMVEILTKLGFGVQGNTISVPSWRTNDVRLSADLVEEIVRIYGLDELPEAPMRADTPLTGMLNTIQKREIIVRRTLASRGLNQALTWSFMDSKLAKFFDSKGIRLANPIASDLDEMRPSLIPNLLSAVKRNQDRGIADVQLFEVGPEFYSTTPTEQRLVACGVRAGAWTPKHWAEQSRTVDVFDAKADAIDALSAMDAPQTQTFRKAPSWYHPGRSGSLCLGKNILAHFGEIHPAILKELDIKTPVVGFEIYMDNLPAPKAAKSKLQKQLKISNLMPLTRDFAFVMDKDVEAERVINTIKGVDKEKITSVSIFDVYMGANLPDGKKSLAVKVQIQPMDKTLTDADIEILSTQIINMVKKNTGADLRN